MDCYPNPASNKGMLGIHGASENKTVVTNENYSTSEMPGRWEPIGASSFTLLLTNQVYFFSSYFTNTWISDNLIKGTYNINDVRLFKPSYFFENATTFKSYRCTTMYFPWKQGIHSHLLNISQPHFWEPASDVS